MSVVFFYIRGA